MTVDTYSNRINSIDSFRLISIFFVILHHIEAFKYSYAIYPSNMILKFLYYFSENVRFLPFFFIAAGYFFRQGILKKDLLKDKLLKYCGRLARLFILWSLIYAFIVAPEGIKLSREYNMFQIFYLNILYLINHPVVFLLRGTIENFWFFPALIIGLIAVSALYRWGNGKYIIPIGLIFYLIALLGKSYSALPFGYHVDFEMRQGPFISTLFVGIGWLLAEKRRYPVKTALVVTFSGLTLQILESAFLYYQYGVKPVHEYLLGTILFCSGIFLFALVWPNVGRNTVFPQWGQLTLGVYAIHMLPVRFLGFLRYYMHPIVWDIIRPIIIYLVSIAVTLLLRRNSVMKLLVT